MRLALGTLLLTGCQLVFKLEDKPNTNELYNPVFVTSLTRSGNLDGVAGADEMCRTAAETQEIEGTFVAWLSTDTTSAIDRLADARGWARLDGQPVADLPGDLAVKGPFVPIALTEAGDDVRGLPGVVFTGTQANGSSMPGRTCTSWTSDNFMDAVRLGDPASGGGSFTDVPSFDAAGCDASNRVYCFGIDRVTPLEVTVNPVLPIAFVSDRPWTPSSGRSMADSICRDDAADASLDGNFLAAVALSTESIAKRFADREYMRPDGVRVGRVLSAELLETFLNVTAEGKVVTTGMNVWTGGSPEKVPTMAETCGDWSNPNLVGVIGGLRDSDGRAFNLSPAGDCTIPERVYCLQN